MMPFASIYLIEKRRFRIVRLPAAGMCRFAPEIAAFRPRRRKAEKGKCIESGSIATCDRDLARRSDRDCLDVPGFLHHRTGLFL
jgi:hypothetical protein